jgi:hypothetical protein
VPQAKLRDKLLSIQLNAGGITVALKRAVMILFFTMLSASLDLTFNHLGLLLYW